MVITPKVQTPDDLFRPPRRYVVPPYQRRYVWSLDDQWEPLWEDISSLVERYLEATDYGKKQIKVSDSPTHFLGAIVLQLESAVHGVIPTCRVIDGQQRLTTLQILLDAAYDEYSKSEWTQQVMLRKLVRNSAEDHTAVRNPRRISLKSGRPEGIRKSSRRSWKGVMIFLRMRIFGYLMPMDISRRKFGSGLQLIKIWLKKSIKHSLKL